MNCMHVYVLPCLRYRLETIEEDIKNGSWQRTKDKRQKKKTEKKDRKKDTYIILEQQDHWQYE